MCERLGRLWQRYFFASWHIEEPTEILGTWEDDHDVMTNAIEALIGHSVSSCQYDPDVQTLVVLFDNNLSLSMVPYVEQDFSDSEAWWLVISDKDRRVIGVNCDLSVSGKY